MDPIAYEWLHKPYQSPIIHKSFSKWYWRRVMLRQLWCDLRPSIRFFLICTAVSVLSFAAGYYSVV